MNKTTLFLVLASAFFWMCTSTKDTVSTPETPDVPLAIEVPEENEDEFIRIARPIYNPSEKRINDVIHTRLEVSFDYANQYLMGLAEITLKPYFYSTDSLTLDAKGFQVNSVQLIKPEGNIDLEYTYDGEFIRVVLDKEYERTEEYGVRIDYVAKPNELEEGGSAAITSDKGLYFINPLGEERNKPIQIWTQGETEASSCWFPTIDAPNERMTQEIFITVDDKYQTLSNGDLVYSNYNDDDTRTDYWNMELPHAPYLAMMAIGEYRIGVDKWENKEGLEIPVTYYIENEYSDYVFSIFGNTPEMIEFYSNILDYEYPWSKYSQVIVRDYVSGAMENTTATVHGEFLNATDREMLDGDNEDIIAHELFHQWFGDLVTCENWANLPLNESFATYGEYLWIEYKYGKDAADYHSHMSRNGYLNEASRDKKQTIRFGYTDKELMFDGHSYNKGGQILHMLRNYVGDEAFFLALNKYLVDNAYQSVEIHQLRLAFEEVTGEDMNWFFNQWFFGIGHPVLDINYDWNDVSKELTVHVRQTQDINKEPIFKLPITIDTYNGTNKTRHQVMMETTEEYFVFELEQEPTWADFDGDRVLLCEKSDNKPNEWFVQQYYNGDDYLSRYEALEQAINIGGEGFEQVIMDAMGDQSMDIQLMAIQGLEEVKNLNQGAENMIRKLAKDDESQVRAAAISAMGRHFNFDDENDYFEGALNDPSFMVISSGLVQITDRDVKRGLSECKKFESEDSFEINNTIGVLYSMYGGMDQFDFFEKQGNEVTGYSRYVFIQNFSTYLQNDPEICDRGMPLLEDMAANSNTWWVKLTAYRSLMQIHDQNKMTIAGMEKLLSETKDEGEKATLEHELMAQNKRYEGMVDRFNAIKANENDQRILNMLSN